MASTSQYQLPHCAHGYAAVYTEETVQKLNTRRPGRPAVRFDIIRKGDPDGGVVVSNITAAQLQAYQAEAERQGIPIDVYYYQPDETADKDAGEVTIQGLRMQTGLSQKEFGDFLYGIPARSIQNWEGGQKSCPVYLVKLIEYCLKKENLISDGAATMGAADGESKG